MARIRETIADRISAAKARPVDVRDLTEGIPQLLTIEDAAAKLAIHPKTVRKLIERGQIPVVPISTLLDKPGARSAVRITDKALDLFVRQRLQFRHDLVRIDDTVAVVRERAIDGAA